MKEEWRDIEGYEGYYQVSNLGRIRRLERLVDHWRKNGHLRTQPERILKQWVGNNRHRASVALCKEGKTIRIPVHRLVAMAFIPNPHNLPCINHKDENPHNNKAENLEWCTYEYNANYGTRNERIAKANGLKVEQYTLDGKYVATFDSVADAGRTLGKKPSAIAVVAKGDGYWSRGKFYKAKQAYGYIWKYVKLKEEGVI